MGVVPREHPDIMDKTFKFCFKYGLKILVCIFLLSRYAYSQTLDHESYRYIVRPGDTLSEIVLMYAGTHDFIKVAQANDILLPDLIHPGQKITVPSSRPIMTLKEYLSSIYESGVSDAYKLLSFSSRQKFSFKDFQDSLKETTFYDLNSISICADFVCKGKHILQMRVYLEEDAANWGFNLIREKYKWYILLFDLNPTSPRENGYVEWKCN